MLRQYELTDDEWNRIVDLLPPENTGKQGRPRKDNRTIVNGMVSLAVVLHGATCQSVMAHGRLFTAVSANG